MGPLATGGTAAGVLPKRSEEWKTLWVGGTASEDEVLLRTEVTGTAAWPKAVEGCTGTRVGAVAARKAEDDSLVLPSPRTRGCRAAKPEEVATGGAVAAFQAAGATGDAIALEDAAVLGAAPLKTLVPVVAGGTAAGGAAAKVGWLVAVGKAVPKTEGALLAGAKVAWLCGRTGPLPVML